jgi:hypothetical protein
MATAAGVGAPNRRATRRMSTTTTTKRAMTRSPRNLNLDVGRPKPDPAGGDAASQREGDNSR